MTMPFLSKTLLLPDGTSIFFTDTGPHPDQPDYITVVIAHGAGFNGRGFDALHDLAHRHGLRLVIINRRHYPGSSPYTPEELTEMADGEKAFARLASNIAMFLVTFIEANHIPPVKDNRGGLAVLGWSIGCVTALSLLGTPKTMLAGNDHSTLLPYLRDVILYDPPPTPFGYDTSTFPPDAYSPFKDPELASPDAKAKAFMTWIASYYDPPPPDWNGSATDLPSSKVKATDTRVTWTDDQLKAMYSPEAAVSDLALALPSTEPFAREAARLALYDEATTRALFPDVRVSVIFHYADPLGFIAAIVEAIHSQEPLTGA
ncbi:hypothetical protein ONZ45_g16907 [Pleurotus djamor]|nr:hypothetical protein ONZ45_g16907 [Pleurotus djamor]